MKPTFLLVTIPAISFAVNCKLVNLQCSDKSPTKTIAGITFTLVEACSKFGLTGDNCCWNATSQYYCADSVDTCKPYRKDSNCSILSNSCIEKDYISGECQKFQSKFSCAGGYKDVESRVCTNVVCSNNEAGTATKCFNPKPPTSENTNNMGNAIAYIQMGQSMAQDMHCSDIHDPMTCTLFSGKYYSCYMYAFKAGQPGTWNNGGADCMINHDAFTQANIPLGQEVSDRKLYSQATSGTNNIMGSNFNYSLSSDDKGAINNSASLHNDSHSTIINQDQNINYNPNVSRNPNISLNNGQVNSVTINKSAIQGLTGLTAFKAYLSDVSVNLAWNRQKAERDPNNIKNTTFSDEGITRSNPNQSFSWSDTPNQPIINGLCVHLADYCEAGEDDATFSDLIKGELAWAGSFTNPNFCAHCSGRDPIFNKCVLGEPKSTLQQWCCFSSKIALDINLAAYDQGLLNVYTGGNRYTDQINHANGICGGVTVAMISKIDFAKANYFKDLMDSMDINQIIDTSNFTDGNIENNTQNRANSTAINIINEWKSKGH